MKYRDELYAIGGASIFAMLFLSLAGEAHSEECRSFSSMIEKSYITLFKESDDYKVKPPRNVQNISFNPEFLKRPHMVGSPDFPYEMQMTFNLTLNSRDPAIDQTNPERVIEVTIDGSRYNPKRDLLSNIFAPHDINVLGEEYLLGEEIFGFELVQYTRGRDFEGVSPTELEFSKRNNVFIRISDVNLKGYLVCQKEDYYKVPYCNARTSVYPFVVGVRFQLKALPNLRDILQQSEKFVSCLKVD